MMMETPQKQIGSILSRALAGYTDDYKHVVDGVTYIRWGAVQEDINAVVAAALDSAVAAERARCAKIACRYCKMEWEFDEGYHVSPSGRAVPCLAAEIRAALAAAPEGEGK